MNQKIIIVLSIFGILLLSQIAFASVSTVSTSMSASRATTGTSITSTVTVTATSSESGSVQLVCTPSGVTISDPSSGSYQGVSLSTSPTSKTFTMTAGTANTYTCQGQSGGVTGDATIVFVDPSSLTVTGTPSSKSVSASGETFILTVNVQNSQSNAIATSYSLSLPSGYSASGDSTSSTVTVSASTTTALTWTITTGTSSGTITFKLGDNSNAFSSSVTVPAASTSTAAAAAAAGGATTAAKKVTTQKGKATITIPTIVAGKSETVDIVKTEDVAIRKIVVSVSNPVNNIQITVGKLPDKPATITQEITGKVYHYIEINKTNVTDADINQTAIRFEVEKSWMTTNNVNKSEVALFRHSNNAWNKLQTTELSDDGTNVLYEAISQGLSVFAIGVEEKEAVIDIPSIPAKGESNFSIDSKALVVTGMKIKAVNALSNVHVVVTKLDARPTELVSDAPGVVNQYIKIERNLTIADADIEKVTINFKLEKTWISANSINESTVALYRYAGDKWNKLETAKTTEDGAYIYYEAVSPGLSVFAVSGESTLTKPAEEEKAAPTAPKGRGASMMIIIVVVVVAIVVLVVLVKKNVIKLGAPIKKKSSWDELKRKYSRNRM